MAEFVKTVDEPDKLQLQVSLRLPVRNIVYIRLYQMLKMHTSLNTKYQMSRSKRSVMKREKKSVC